MKYKNTLPNNYPHQLKAKFLARLAKYNIVQSDDECWEWRGTKAFYNYGILLWKHGLYRAHRVAWETFRGIIPENMFVLHHCDNPPCCNPKHLFLGTQADNVRDRDNKGRGNQKHSQFHPRSKLTARQVKKIKELYFSGRMTQYQLANKFGVKQSGISRIIRGLRYRDIKNNKPIPIQSISPKDYRKIKGKTKYSPELKAQARHLFSQGKKVKEIAEELKINKTSAWFICHGR